MLAINVLFVSDARMAEPNRWGHHRDLTSASLLTLGSRGQLFLGRHLL